MRSLTGPPSPSIASTPSSTTRVSRPSRARSSASVGESPGATSASERVEAGGDERLGRGLPVRGHPDSPQAPPLAACRATRVLPHPGAPVRVTHRLLPRRMRRRSRVLVPTHARSQHQIRLSTHTSEYRWFHRCRPGRTPPLLSPARQPGVGVRETRRGVPRAPEAGSRRFGGTATEAGWGSGGATSGSSVPSVPLCPWALGRAPDRALGRPCRCRPSARVSRGRWPCRNSSATGRRPSSR